MPNFKSLTTSAAPKLLSVLRIIIGFLFAEHGGQKLFAFPIGMPGMGKAPLLSFLGFAGTLELVGGLLILVGLFTRPVAFILSGMMAFAYFTVHAKGGFWPLVNQGELAVAYCFVFLYLAAAGPGAWSVDSARTRNAPIR